MYVLNSIIFYNYFFLKSILYWSNHVISHSVISSCTYGVMIVFAQEFHKMPSLVSFGWDMHFSNQKFFRGPWSGSKRNQRCLLRKSASKSRYIILSRPEKLQNKCPRGDSLFECSLRNIFVSICNINHSKWNLTSFRHNSLRKIFRPQRQSLTRLKTTVLGGGSIL